MRTILLALAAIAAAAPDARAQVEPPFVSILAVRDAGGWRIDAEVEAFGTTSASVTPPGGLALDLPCETGEPALCERIEPAPPAAGAATLAALLAQFPVGSWSLAINGGALTAAIPFDPQEPDGGVTVTDPASGAIGVSSTPSVSYANGCASCNFIELRIEDLPTLGESIELESLQLGTPPMPSGQLAFADFFDGPPVPLPDGSYQIFAAAGIGDLGSASFDQGGSIQYGTGAEQQSVQSFAVPEPRGVALAAVAAVAALASRRRHAARRTSALGF